MNVLGISAFYHDSSAALISDGKIVAAAAEERFTRQKHDPNYPRFSIDFCLKEVGLAAQELDRIVFYEDPYIKFTRVLASSLAPFPFSRSAFVRSMRTWLGEKLWVKNQISKNLDVHPDKIAFIPHHLSHAAQAFIGSSFEEAAILTVDAVGEWSSTSLYSASWDGGLKFKEIEVIPYPHSLGLAYSVFTAFIGFRPMDGECSTMALASFGKPIYADQVRKILRVQKDGSYDLDQSYFNFNQFSSVPYSKKFLKVFGEPRRYKDKLPFNTLSENGNAGSEASADHQRYADIAASVQLVLEEALLGLIGKLHKATGLKNLCMAGGVALNCVANTRILKESPFENLFVPPDPGDGGGALGAASYYSFTEDGASRFDPNLCLTPFLGKEYDEDRDTKMLEHVDTDEWINYRAEGAAQGRGMRLNITHHRDFDDLIPGVVDDIKAGHVVGWVQGRFENGPRALGNRSLLIDPGRLDIARKMSLTVKARAPFRPYALSITGEAASKVLDLDGQVPSTAKWMQMVSKVKDDAIPSVRAALHVDSSTRPQVCNRNENPRYHKLLTAYGESTGLPALLNTSFNESGYPLVSSPVEAMLVFARTNMDTLVINNSVVRKVDR
jgi:carbamoyltransferase